jgi:hypothetical protein
MSPIRVRHASAHWSRSCGASVSVAWSASRRARSAASQPEERPRPVFRRVLEPGDPGPHPRRVPLVRFSTKRSPHFSSVMSRSRSNPTFSAVISASNRSLSPRSFSISSRSCGAAAPGEDPTATGRWLSPRPGPHSRGPRREPHRRRGDRTFVGSRWREGQGHVGDRGRHSCRCAGSRRAHSHREQPDAEVHEPGVRDGITRFRPAG